MKAFKITAYTHSEQPKVYLILQISKKRYRNTNYVYTTFEVITYSKITSNNQKKKHLKFQKQARILLFEKILETGTRIAQKIVQKQFGFVQFFSLITLI